MDKFLKIRFIGDNMSPIQISSNELARIISAYENAIVELFEKVHPDKKDVGKVSVTGISNQSVGIQFYPNFQDEMVEVADTINKSIDKNTLYKLPYNTVKNLSVIQKFVYSKNCVAELNGYDGISSARITPTTNIDINKSFYIKGETTVYGKIMRIGGAMPRVRIEFDDGRQFSVITKESEAKRLSPFLYETIGIKGMATWKKENYELEEITPSDFIIMNDSVSLKDKLKGLSELIGKYWINIKDPDLYVEDLRS